MTRRPTFEDVAKNFKIAGQQLSEIAPSAEEVAAAFTRFSKAYWQAVFQDSIDKKFPDPAKYQGDTLKIFVEELPPGTFPVEKYRKAVFTKETGKWTFSHFTPPLP